MMRKIRTIRTLYPIGANAVRQLRWLESAIGAPPETIITAALSLLFTTWRSSKCAKNPHEPSPTPRQSTCHSEFPEPISDAIPRVLARLTKPSHNGFARRSAKR